MQQTPDIQKSDSKERISCLKRTVPSNRRKVCVIFRTGTKKLKIVVYRYRNNSYLKDKEIDLNMTGNQTTLARPVNLLSYFDIFSSDALYWMKHLFRIKTNFTNFIKNGCLPSNETLLIVLWIQNVLSSH